MLLYELIKNDQRHENLVFSSMVLIVINLQFKVTVVKTYIPQILEVELLVTLLFFNN